MVLQICIESIICLQDQRVSVVFCSFCTKTRSLTAVNRQTCSKPVAAPIRGECVVLHNCKLLIDKATKNLPPDGDKPFCCKFCAMLLEYDLQRQRSWQRFSFRRLWRNIKGWWYRFYYVVSLCWFVTSLDSWTELLLQNRTYFNYHVIFLNIFISFWLGAVHKFRVHLPGCFGPAIFQSVIFWSTPPHSRHTAQKIRDKTIVYNGTPLN